MRPWRKAARERKEKGARSKEKGKSRNPPKAAHSAAVHGGTLTLGALGALGARHGQGFVFLLHQPNGIIFVILLLLVDC